MSATLTSQHVETATGTAATYQLRTPGSVTAARVVLVLHGLLIGGLGFLLLDQPAVPQWLAIGSIVEGGLRIVLGLKLQRGTHHIRKAALVLAGIGTVVSALNLPFGIIGIALNVSVYRCLGTAPAKEHFGA